MKEMMMARKAELEARGKKGFTLMEMLIVVAIIAVLIAIAIPVFTSQLENARLATDQANIRGGYAAATAAILTADTPSENKYFLQKDGTVSQTSGENNYKTQVLVSHQNVDISGQTVNVTPNKVATYKFSSASQKITIAVE